MKIVYAESAFWGANEEFQKAYESVIRTGFTKAKEKLINIPENVTFVCQANDWETIPETGEGAYTRNSRLILLSINPSMPFSKEEVLVNVEAAVLHELNHAARFELGIWHHTLLESCIMEGLATVFEKKYARRGVPLWGNYNSDETAAWFNEINSVQNNAEWNDYMFTHPDGRRWIGYKVGTWLIDEAMKKSGKTIEELTFMGNTEILSLAAVT